MTTKKEALKALKKAKRHVLEVYKKATKGES